MRLLFLGQNLIAEKCLEVLAEYQTVLELVCLVGSPSLFESYQGVCRTIDNEQRNEAAILNAIEELDVDILISVQHPWILTEKILRAVEGKAFNLHNAKLPDYRGHHSISYAILNGDKEYSTSIHQMIAEVDLGDLCYELSTEIDGGDTAKSLYEKTVELSVENFRRFLRGITSDQPLPLKKMDSSVGQFYSRHLINEMKVIRDSEPRDIIERKARAFYFPPFEPAYMLAGQKKLYVLPASWMNEK